MELDKLLRVKMLRSFSRQADGEPPKPEAKRKDAWDKTAIVVSATSSVVIALAALLINFSIQRSQVENTTRAAEAQIRSQSLKNTTDLIQYLLSGEPLKQQIALVALRGAVENNDDVVVDIVRIVALQTGDASVKNEAVETLKRSKSPRAAETLSLISRSQSTPDEIKDPAYMASQVVALRSTLDMGTAILFATQPGQVAFEDSSLGGSVFTHFLLKALDEDPAAIQGRNSAQRNSANLSHLFWN
jgi:hypothetical protein